MAIVAKIRKKLVILSLFLTYIFNQNYHPKQ